MTPIGTLHWLLFRVASPQTAQVNVDNVLLEVSSQNVSIIFFFKSWEIICGHDSWICKRPDSRCSSFSFCFVNRDWTASSLCSVAQDLPFFNVLIKALSFCQRHNKLSRNEKEKLCWDRNRRRGRNVILGNKCDKKEISKASKPSTSSP